MRMDDTMVKLTMGEFVDYYMPVTGVSLCEMLQSGHKHKWSPDGRNWQTPRYNESQLGGSCQDGFDKSWLTDKFGRVQEADTRKYLSFWGYSNQSGEEAGGCCYTNESESFGWHRAFTMSSCYLEAPMPANDTLSKDKLSLEMEIQILVVVVGLVFVAFFGAWLVAFFGCVIVDKVVRSASISHLKPDDQVSAAGKPEAVGAAAPHEGPQDEETA